MSSRGGPYSSRMGLSRRSPVAPGWLIWALIGTGLVGVPFGVWTAAAAGRPEGAGPSFPSVSVSMSPSVAAPVPPPIPAAPGETRAEARPEARAPNPELAPERASVDAGRADGGRHEAGRTDGGEAPCPEGMILVEGESCGDVLHTCLDPMPDDPARRCREFKVGADVCMPPKRPLRFCMDKYEYPGIPGVQPRVLVDFYEAGKLCAADGKRMCTEDEFYLACEGPEHWPYAWGHVRHPSPCSIDRPYYPVDWNKWGRGGSAMREEARRLDQALPIGSSSCVSPYGIHDIAGNVDEWTAARSDREFEGSLNGGYWGPVQNACRYVTLVHGPEFIFYQIGFRCCADAEAS